MRGYTTLNGHLAISVWSPLVHKYEKIIYIGLVGTPLPRWLPVGWDAALVAPSPLSIPVTAWWVMVMRNNIGPVIVVNESDLLLQPVPGLPLRLSWQPIWSIRGCRSFSAFNGHASILKRAGGSRYGCRGSGNTLTECYFSIPSVLLSVSEGYLYQQKEWRGYQVTQHNHGNRVLFNVLLFYMSYKTPTHKPRTKTKLPFLNKMFCIQLFRK